MMEQNNNIIGVNDFLELVNLEEQGQKCIDELQSEGEKLRKTLADEIEIQDKLTQLSFELESKISVNKDKIEDLNIEEMEQSISELKFNMDEGKNHVNQFSEEAIQKSWEMAQEVLQLVKDFESQRMQFKSVPAMSNGIKTKLIQTDQYLHKVKKADAELETFVVQEEQEEIVNLDAVKCVLESAEKMIQELESAKQSTMKRGNISVRRI